MVTPPKLIFYVSMIVVLINLFKVFFNKEYGEDEVIITMGAIAYIVVYLIAYVIINYGR